MSSLSEIDLSKAIGVTVEITFQKSNTKLTGNIMSIIKKANLLILVNKPEDEKQGNLTSYTININQIKSIKLCDKQVDVDINELMKIDLDKVQDNEKRNLSKDILIKKAETEPNFEKGLNIYEALSKLYKCSYDGKKIVLDDIDSYIEAPFRLNNLHCEDEDNKQRLTKIIASVLKAKK